MSDTTEEPTLETRSADADLAMLAEVFGEDMDTTDSEKLPVKLTEAELLLKSDQAAKLYVEIQEMTEAETVRRRLETKRIREKREAFESLNTQLATHEEHREVQIRMFGDTAENLVNVVRMDTGAKVRDRAMSAKERERLLQRPLEFKNRADDLPEEK